MTYYSALHYAAKAEKSAKLAEQYATQATSFSGKVIQIGFDGFMENGQLVFKHSPAGVDIPYDLLDDYEYEIDMAYSGTDLADNVEIVVKNGADTINFVSALHRDSTTPVTVKEMKSVMRYDERTGYRWLFKAAFKVTPSGNKVLLLYPVISVGGSGSGLNVGDIFYTSRLDTELNGAVEANGGVYAVADFTGAQSVPELLRKGSLPFVSMTEYDEIVSANGSCRAWGWNNGDTFRVPTLKDVYLMAGTAETAGEFIGESLPNITGDFQTGQVVNASMGQMASGTGAFARSENSTGNTNVMQRTDGGFAAYSMTFDASRVSEAYQDGAKVHPNSVKYRAMVQVATGTTDEALATCTGVLADIANVKDRTHIVETYRNGTEWYRVWSDGWCEQGGVISAPNAGQHMVNLIRPFTSTDYRVDIQQNIYVNAAQANNAIATKTTTDFTLTSGVAGSVNFDWCACGY